jgi:flagellar secretion chaperone FliS
MKSTIDARKIYQDNAVQGAAPIDLVVILYDAAIEDMRRALAAMKKSEIEARTAAVQHAFIILQQLQGTLDFERGGSSARQFEQFYNVVRAKLLEAQLQSSPELMQQQIRCLSEVRDCWLQAKRMLQPRQGSGAVLASVAASNAEEPISASEWNA